VREVRVGGVRPLARAQASVALAGTGVGIGGETIDPVAGAATTWAVPWAALAAVALVVGLAVWLPGVADRRRRRAAPRTSSGA
jgi:hypothetical protein